MKCGTARSGQRRFFNKKDRYYSSGKRKEYLSFFVQNKVIAFHGNTGWLILRP